MIVVIIVVAEVGTVVVEQQRRACETVSQRPEAKLKPKSKDEYSTLNALRPS